jgi:hypothetical protein
LAVVQAQGRDSRRQVLGFYREDRKVLITTSVTPGMAGDLGGIALPHALRKRLHALHQLLVGLIRIRHDPFLDNMSDVGFPEEKSHYTEMNARKLDRRSVCPVSIP